jgi:DNA-binding Lrp family transcriptional regulator
MTVRIAANTSSFCVSSALWADRMTTVAVDDAVDLDDLDRRLIQLLRREPHLSVSELARRTDQPRATVHSRQARLERRRIITGYGPDVSAVRIGYGVMAFTSLEIAQGSHDETIAGLRAINEVLEVHTVTGAGDLLCRIIAKSNDDLHQVLQRITALSTVTRSQTQIALSTQLQRTAADLVADSLRP